MRRGGSEHERDSGRRQRVCVKEALNKAILAFGVARKMKRRPGRVAAKQLFREGARRLRSMTRCGAHAAAPAPNASRYRVAAAFHFPSFSMASAIENGGTSMYRRNLCLLQRFLKSVDYKIPRRLQRLGMTNRRGYHTAWKAGIQSFDWIPPSASWDHAGMTNLRSRVMQGSIEWRRLHGRHLLQSSRQAYERCNA